MKKLIFILKIGLYLFLIGFLFIFGLYLYAYITPKTDLKTSNKIYMYDESNNLISIGSNEYEWTNLEDISPYFLDAIVSIEDKSFYSHHGFDYLRIMKAMYKNIKSGSLKEGASTISQQYIKNMYLDFNKTWKRKIEEAYLTLELEVHYTKEEILEGYVNTINYGQGNFDIGSASKFYFNKKPIELTLEEAIILAGISKNPSNYNPLTNYDKSIQRAKTVAKAMLNNKKITEENYNTLFRKKIAIYGNSNNEDMSNTIMYYYDAVLNELNSIKNIPKSLIESGSLKVYTTFNENAQKGIDSAIKNELTNSELQTAAMIVNPQDGAVLALAGGNNYFESEFNRAIAAKRQIGSTMKPILYYAALENGLTSSTTFLCEPTTFVFSNNKTYSPANYNNLYANKEITMATAISLSDNIYAVKTHLFLGEEVLVNTAKKVGISSNLQAVPSLALGSNEMTMLDLATAYTTLASGGYKNDLFFIRKVEDNNGNILYEKQNNKILVLNPNYTYIINELLTSTYNSAFKDYTTPTLSSISAEFSRKYAIKSGSTNTDFWVVGYNPDLLTIVWNGKDNSTDMTVGESKITKNIWLKTMENASKSLSVNWYETPENVVGVLQNAVTGKFDNKNPYLFYYLKGSEPKK